MKVAVPALALLSLALAACGQTTTPSSGLVTVSISMPTAATSNGLRTLGTPTIGTDSAVKAVKIMVTDADGAPVKFDDSNAVSADGTAYLTLTPDNEVFAQVHPGVTYHFKSAGFDNSNFANTSRHLVAFNQNTSKAFTDSDKHLTISLSSVIGGAALTTTTTGPVVPQQVLDYVLDVNANGVPTSTVPQSDFSASYVLVNGTLTNTSERGMTAKVNAAPTGNMTIAATVSGLILDPYNRDNAISGTLQTNASIATALLSGGITVDLKPPTVNVTSVTAKDTSTLQVIGTVSDNYAVGSVKFFIGSTRVANPSFVGGKFDTTFTGVKVTDLVTLIVTDTSDNERRVNVTNAVANFVSPLSVYVDANSTASTPDGSYNKPFKTLIAGYSAVDSNGTLHLAAGTFNDDLTVSKKLILTGPNAGKAGYSLARGPEAIITGMVTLDGTASGSTIDGIEIKALALGDSTQYDRLKLILSDNVTVQNSLFVGPGHLGALWGSNDNTVAEVVRGIVPSPATLGVAVMNNLFVNIRQPGFINPGVTGIISGNRAVGTTGWLDYANVTFTNNTFQGTQAEVSTQQAADIILAGDDLTDLAFCTALSPAAIRAANSGVVVADRRPTTCQQ